MWLEWPLKSELCTRGIATTEGIKLSITKWGIGKPYNCLAWIVNEAFVLDCEALDVRI